jgi:hypothetical protein
MHVINQPKYSPFLLFYEGARLQDLLLVEELVPQRAIVDLPGIEAVDSEDED